MTISLHQGGVVMSSQITLAQLSNIHPLAHISSCTLFTVYPIRIIKWHSIPLQVISYQSA